MFVSFSVHSTGRPIYVNPDQVQTVYGNDDWSSLSFGKGNEVVVAGSIEETLKRLAQR